MGLRTPLYEQHAKAGATFVEFSGYDMPVHYGSIKEEHQQVRTSAGLFDVSHMSNLWLDGSRAAEALAKVTPSNPQALEMCKGKYTVILREDGTVLDDAFYFRTGPEEYLLIPNAGMNDIVRQHITTHTPAAVRDETRDWAILALQGPVARAILKEASPSTAPKFHRIEEMQIAGHNCLVSGTGYTGEKGVEIYVGKDAAVDVWNHLLEVGGERLKPIGLGARDTLRLEKGYCLAGHEFEGGRTPLEAGLSWLVDWESDALGMDVLRNARDKPHDELWGLSVAKGVPRQGYKVFAGDEERGIVTSGTMSPTTNTGIALAYIRGAAADDEVTLDVRGRRVAATVQKPPFV